MNLLTVLVIAVLVCSTEYDFVFANSDDDGESIVRCVTRERKALLKFKEGLVDEHGMLSTWGKEKECCKWEGVQCSNTTGHVIALQLVGQYLGGTLPSEIGDLTYLRTLDLTNNYFSGTLPPEIGNLTNLYTLDLSSNDFLGTVPPQIGNLINLEALDLSYNRFSGTIPIEIGNLTNLKTLDLSSKQFFGRVPPQIGNLINLEALNLSYNNFFETIPIEIGNLTNLKTLDLRSNQFSGTLPSEMGNLINLVTLDLWSNRFSGTLPIETGNLINLKTLHLAYNQFSGVVPPQIGNLINLETLDLTNNGFFGILPPQLWSLPNLKTLDLSVNNLSSSIDDSLLNMSTNHVAHSLTTLDLRGNKLKRLPSSIWQHLRLEELRVSNNSLEDTITEADLSKHTNLRTLDLSFNSLTLDISPDWTPPFQLREIGLSGCKVGPHFPLWLRTQINFTTLDLSLSGISGEVPKWFLRNFSNEVVYLNISHNQLSGTLSHFSSIQIQYLDVSSNNFSGPLPLVSPITSIFRMSQNMFSGSLSFNCSIPYQLWLLDLSDNQLSGKLPKCWGNMTHLLNLNLANNHFSGEIPHSLSSLSNLVTLQLSKNKLTGQLPSTLKNCKGLQFVDIGDNMLSGSIPTWIGEYRDTMSYLIIPNNRFHGRIPPQICYLSEIQVLDLSGNDISGQIPPCFQNFTYFVETNMYIPDFQLSSLLQVDDLIRYTIVFWKHKEHKYGRNLMNLKLIDLSSNRLEGDIPNSFSSLKGLPSLNLSRNSLTGIIDPNIGQMELLESLDLSSNQLSGAIPDGMAKLNFLSVLDLAKNNLSGKIPVGRQLQTFPQSAYAGNIGLCGRPLPLCSVDRPNSSTNNVAFQHVDDDGGILSLSFLKEVGIPIILGFIFGFWGIVGSLIVKESWRRVFYIFCGSVEDWLYVRVTLFWTKLRRS